MRRDGVGERPSGVPIAHSVDLNRASPRGRRSQSARSGEGLRRGVLPAQFMLTERHFHLVRLGRATLTVCSHTAGRSVNLFGSFESRRGSGLVKEVLNAKSHDAKIARFIRINLN